MGRYKIETIPYNGRDQRTEDLVSDAYFYAQKGNRETALEIASLLMKHAHEKDDKKLWDEANSIMKACNTPLRFSPDYNHLQATSENNRPYGAPTVMEELAEDSDVPKKTKNPRRFTLSNDYKEKMLYLLYLTWYNGWYECKDGSKLAATDVYYWFGVLLDYRFDNKTGKLSEIFDKENDEELYKLAVELNNLSVEFKKMAEKAKEGRKR